MPITWMSTRVGLSWINGGLSARGGLAALVDPAELDATRMHSNRLPWPKPITDPVGELKAWAGGLRVWPVATCART